MIGRVKISIQRGGMHAHGVPRMGQRWNQRHYLLWIGIFYCDLSTALPLLSPVSRSVEGGQMYTYMKKLDTAQEVFKFLEASGGGDNSVRGSSARNYSSSYTALPRHRRARQLQGSFTHFVHFWSEMHVTMSAFCGERRVSARDRSRQ